ncbi:MAG TPA: FdtA/QdtA family cupin domain-containing protein [Melioribacteraceae bacterium]|nr:FdtA/QdtA family cupin domain-containing protein [Melioribacteraceae bacterium]
MENKARILKLPEIINNRGSLSYIETHRHVPFDIKRVFWIYDVPGGEIRGGHAYQEQHEFIIALSGSFDVIVDDGFNTQKFSLNRSYFGLLIPALNWRQLENFSTNALSLHLSSKEYDYDDYIREYEKFLELVKK